MTKSTSSAVGWREVKKTLADGTVRVYRYATGARRALAPAPDTLQALTLAWRASPEWRRFAPRTQQSYLTHLREIEHAPRVPLSALRRRDFLAWRDRIAGIRGEGAAAMWLSVVASMLSWAVEREWIETSPLRGLRGQRATAQTPLPAWTEEEYLSAVARLPERLRRAVVLARHTGQRAGDLVKMRWTDVAGDTLRVVQSKTGVLLSLPLAPALTEELPAWRRDATTPFLLERAPGASWRQSKLSDAVGTHLKKLGMGGKGLHGLRKLCAASLAEAGATPSEIAAVTGHRTLAMVAHYTRSADQERLARAAFRRLDPVGERFHSNEKDNVKSIR